MHKKRKTKIIGILFLFLAFCFLYQIVWVRDPKDPLSPLKEELHTTGDPLLNDLYVLAKKDARVEKVIENREQYPESLLKMLAKNIDMLDYVLAYPTEKGKVFSSTIGKVTKGDFPLLLQYDKRWGYGEYGDNVIAISGCGPTVLSIVVAGLTGRNDVTPYVIGKEAMQKGYYQKEVGTAWSIMTEGLTDYGIRGTNISLSKNTLLSELKQGHPIICSMRPGDFTTTGHYIVLTGVKNGKFVIKDPNSLTRSEKLWSYETLQSQIKNLWSFQTY